MLPVSLHPTRQRNRCYLARQSLSPNRCRRSSRRPVSLSETSQNWKNSKTNVGRTVLNNVASLIRTSNMVGDENDRRVARALDGAIVDIKEAVGNIGIQRAGQGICTTGRSYYAQQAARHCSCYAGREIYRQKGRVHQCCKQHQETSSKTFCAQQRPRPTRHLKNTRNQLHSAATAAARAVVQLLESIKAVRGSNTPGNKTSVQQAAKSVAGAVAEVVNAASVLIPGGYVDQSDPNVIAEPANCSWSRLRSITLHKETCRTSTGRRKQRESGRRRTWTCRIGQGCVAAAAALIRWCHDNAARNRCCW